MLRLLPFTILFLLVQVLPAQMKMTALSSTKGGSATGIAIQDNFLYVGCGASLVVYDVSPSLRPPYERRFTASLGSRVNDIQVRGKDLYIAQHHGGISRWDISRPESPVLSGSFKLQGANRPAYDITLVKDTLIVAFEDRIVVLRERRDLSAGFEFLYSFGEMGARGGRITAGDAKGAWYACVTGWETEYYRSALFLFNWRTGKQIHFYPRKFGNARDVVWDDRFMLLHIAGGQHPETGEGLYYATMVGDRGGLREIYADTIPNGDAVKLRKHEGSVWLAAGSGRAGACNASQIRIYRAEGIEKVVPDGFLRAVWAEDIAFENGRIHIAAAESGILHMPEDSRKNRSCQFTPPPDVTPTGAGCSSAARFGDRLVALSPGYGMSIYDISYPRRMTPIYFLDHAETAQKAIFSDDGKYLYILHKGQGGNYVEVRETESWRQVGRVYGPWGYRYMERYGDRLYLRREAGNGFDVVDVSRARQPEREQAVLMPVTDLQVDGQGRLLISNPHNIRIFDIRKGTMKEILNHSKWGAKFGEIVGVGEDIVVYQPEEGLVRYALEKSGSEMVLVPQRTVKAPYPDPDIMIASDQGIWIGYNDYGIFTMDPQELTRQNFLETGLGFLDQKGEALQDLVLSENLLLVIEFFGQVSIVDTGTH